MIDEKKLAEMKAFAESCDNDVLGVTIPKEQMAAIADTALQLWKENAELKETIRWMAQTVHQAYHEKNTFRECPKNTCDAATQALAALKDKPCHR